MEDRIVALFQMNSTLRKLPELDHSQLYQPGISQENKATVTIPRIKGLIEILQQP